MSTNMKHANNPLKKKTHIVAIGTYQISLLSKKYSGKLVYPIPKAMLINIMNAELKLSFSAE